MTHFFSEFIHGNKKIHYTEMSELYVSLSLRALAMGVGGLFVPLFLYDIGFSLIMIAGFYIFSMGIRVPLEFVAAKLIGWVGVKHTMILSYLSLFLHFVVLYAMTSFPWLWPLAGIFLAGQMAFFWIGYHFHVSNIRNLKHGSSQISITIILRRVFMAAGPFLGGLVAAAYGVEFTLPLASLFLLLAAYPLFKTPDTKPVKFDLSNLDFDLGRDKLAHMAWQVSGISAGYLWPLWLLLVLGSYSQIGTIIALSVILGIALTFWVGRLGDKGYNDLLLKIGTGIKSLAHLLRVVASMFGLALLANATNDLADNFIIGPYTEEYYEASDEGQRFRYILKTNIMAALARFLTWVVFMLMAVLLIDLMAIQAMFVLAALVTPTLIWVSQRRV